MYLLADLPMPADANLQLAKIGMAYWQILTQIAQTLAMRAIGITGQAIGQVIVRRSRGGGLSLSRLPTLCSGGELFQCRVDLFAHGVLFLSNVVK